MLLVRLIILLLFYIQTVLQTPGIPFVPFCRYFRAFFALSTTSATETTTWPYPAIALTTASGTTSPWTDTTTRWRCGWMAAEGSGRWRDCRAEAGKSSSTRPPWCWGTPSPQKATRAFKVGKNGNLQLGVYSVGLKIKGSERFCAF